MRLLVISHTPHYRRAEEIVGWGPTIRELDHLASRFERVRHVACLHSDAAPESALAYRAKNIELVPVPPAGADGFLGKLDVLRTSPTYLRTIVRELGVADMVHVRAPANIALIAMLVLAGRKHPTARWFKYAGNWTPNKRESASYAIQRWWLRRGRHGGLVTVNGAWPDQAAWIRTFYNPSLDDDELEQGKRAAAAKHLGTPIRLLYVGQLLASKGAGRAIEVLARVRERGVEAVLEIVGDGSERATFEAAARALNVEAHVAFRGWQTPTRIHRSYEQAHFLILPSAGEGWPKVLSEGMAFGAVPLAGAVSSIPQYLRAMKTGAAFDPFDLESFASAIESYARDVGRWQTESANAVAAAAVFSYRSYLESVDDLLETLAVRSTSA